MATVTMKAPAPGGLSNKARELMEAINTDAGKHNVWVRTQANSPAQKPWFSETSGEGSGQLATGRVAVNQMKTVPYMWKWNEYNGYLKQISEIASKADVSPIEFADRQSILVAQSRPERPPAGDQHHPLRHLDLQSGRRRAGASAFAECEPHHSVQEGRLHRRRRREGHRKLRRSHSHAERHLARPRQRFRRAGDLDRYARLAADGIPRRRLGRPQHARRARQHQRAGGHRQGRLFPPSLQPWRHQAGFRRSPARRRPRARAAVPLSRRRRAGDAARAAQREGRPATRASRSTSSIR